VIWFHQVGHRHLRFPDRPWYRHKSEPSFSQYWTRHFTETRGPWAFGICLGLITIPILSLLKPAIGFKGLAITLAVVIFLSSLLLLIYSLQRAIAYFLRRQRSVPNRARSRTAALGFTGLLWGVMIAPLVGAELFTPRCGLLVTLIPQLQEEQPRPILPDEDRPKDSDNLTERAARATADHSISPAPDGPIANTETDDPTMDPGNMPPMVSSYHTSSDSRPNEHAAAKVQPLSVIEIQWMTLSVANSESSTVSLPG